MFVRHPPSLRGTMVVDSTGMPRDAFGHDEPVAVEDDPEGGLKELLANEVGDGDPDTVEPVLDE